MGVLDMLEVNLFSPHELSNTWLYAVVFLGAINDAEPKTNRGSDRKGPIIRKQTLRLEAMLGMLASMVIGELVVIAFSTTQAKSDYSPQANGIPHIEVAQDTANLRRYQTRHYCRVGL
jgi:hypothetical protein